jgi:hypothetical protein
MASSEHSQSVASAENERHYWCLVYCLFSLEHRQKYIRKQLTGYRATNQLHQHYMVEIDLSVTENVAEIKEMYK